ncbi:MAG: FkbM family methyltransferase [Acidobacteriota bacterium]
MSAVRTLARAALLDLACRLVRGRGLAAAERRRVARDLALAGFRKTAYRYLLDGITRQDLRPEGANLVFPVLGGLFVIACAAGDLGVGWDLLQEDTYEPHVAAYLRRTLRPGMCVVDVGANIGFHALHAAHLVRPEGRVFALEPDPRNASLMRLSLSLNPPDLAVEVIEAAASDADGELILSDCGNAANSGARFTHEDRARLDRLVHGAEPTFQSVRALCWDEHFPEQRIDLIKIDIEGFEPRALRGMERAILRDHPIVLTELAPSNLRDLGNTTPAAYLAWYRERGYAGWILEDDGAASVPAEDAEIASRLRGRHHLDLVFTAG